MRILDDEKCPKCGVPSWWAYSTNNIIDFEMDEQVCQACAHKERHEADQAKSKVKPKAGAVAFVKAKPVEGYELPTRRDFYEAMAKEK